MFYASVHAIVCTMTWWIITINACENCMLTTWKHGNGHIAQASIWVFSILFFYFHLLLSAHALFFPKNRFAKVFERHFLTQFERKFVIGWQTGRSFVLSSVCVFFRCNIEKRVQTQSCMNWHALLRINCVRLKMIYTINANVIYAPPEWLQELMN